jgi:hypothetical protein
MSATSAALPAAARTHRSARWSLILALLGIPGSTIAWDLPAGGFWIGMPLAFAAVAIGVRCLPDAVRRARWMAIAGIALAAVEILFTATWTVAG